MKIASALNKIIQKSYSMYTPRVARAVRLVALHTLRAHCALCRYTFQVWVTPHLAQGHVERVCGGFAHVIILHISLVSPMLRPSPPTPSLLSPHGQRDWSAASDIFSDLPGPKIAGPAHSDKGEYVPGHLVKGAHLTLQKESQSGRPESSNPTTFSQETTDRFHDQCSISCHWCP